MSIMKNIREGKMAILFTAIILILINWFASQFHARIDLTNEKRFTLSKATKKILRNIGGEVHISVFLKGEFPSGFKKLALSTEEILQEFKEIAGIHLKYDFINPDENVEGAETKWGDTLSALGMIPINLTSQVKAGEQQQLIYPVALVNYGENTVPVRIYNGSPLVSYKEINTAEALLEFAFADAINKATQTSKPMVAYATGNGEPQLFSNNDTLAPDLQTYDLTYTLRKNYSLFTFNLQTQPVIPDTFKLLMIVKPTATFSPEEKLKIDQFVMRGGKLLMFIDKLNAEADSLQIKNEVIAYDRNLQLDDLLFKYGARINDDLVLDLQSDRIPFNVNGNGQFEFLKWNYYPVLISKSDHTVNKNIGFVSGKFVNSIDTISNDDIKKTILLSTSENGKKVATPALISGRENQIAPNDSSFSIPNIPVAMLLEGKFTSMFSNRLSQSMNDSLNKYGVAFQSQCLYDNKVIIVSDGDMVLNPTFKDEPLPMGYNKYTFQTQYEIQYANRDFLQNCLDYLVDQSGLSEARSKDYVLRLLDKKKTDQDRFSWQLMNIAVPVLLICLFAFIYQFVRRRKYTFKK